MKLKAIGTAIAVLLIPVCLYAQLSAPVRTGTRNPLNCYDQGVEMKTFGGNTVAVGISGSKAFIWEYTEQDPSAIPNPTYQQFAQSQGDSIFFFPYLSFPRGQESQINRQRFRYIRCKLARLHPSTGAVLETVATSNPTPVLFSPSRPFSNVAEVLNTTASCANAPTGVVHMDITKYTDTIMYIVRIGANNNAFCNPETNSPPCFSVIKSGRATTSSFDITGLPAGSYTVLLANTGMGAGACFESYNATVTVRSPISIDTAFVRHPPCYGDSLGSIRLLVGGGDAGTYRFFITPAQPSALFTYANGEAKWQHLKAGSYTVAFMDTCGLPVTRNLSVTQPPKVTGSVLVTVPDCDNPGNGTIRVKAGYNFASPGFASYDYRIYQNGSPYDSLLNTTDTMFTKPGLRSAAYRVTVTSPGLPGCPGIDETIPLPFVPLAVTADSVKHVSCNGGGDGHIRLRATGGSGSYTYSLRNNATGFTFTDTTGLFDNLAAGSYTGRATNRATGCSDSAAIAIAIMEPTAMAASATKTDVRCKGMDNGTLSASATGGNGSYEYRWQVLVNGNWATYFQTGANVTGVPPGIYRAWVRDIKNCTGFSAPLTITEPDSLRIDSVSVHDIPCYAGQGNITLFGSGGNGGYVQQYKSQLGGAWVDFTPITGLAAGEYLIRLVDAKGCSATWPSAITITMPPGGLDFTYQQTVYNGYHITCFGAANGSIAINATGGNGGGYTGYMYRYDNMPWQTSNVLTGVPGGNRNVQVRDARGCTASRQVTFLEPTDSLRTTLVSKTDISCYGASTGSISVGATGGVRPYRYNVDGGTFVSDSTFRNLTAGAHTVSVKDINGCTGNITVTLVNTNTAIGTANNIGNVSCNGGSNGSISVSVSGGVAPYNYSWSPVSGTTNSIANLPAGIYTLKVTDNAGCARDFPIMVTQPAALVPTVTARQVCYGATTGSIAVQPIGGTPPFKYSKDNGTTFSNDSVFSNLAAGSYNIVVRDAKGCTFATTSTVTVTSNNPNLNFIISSNQHAQDTLTMKEISWVKPDSVKWVFHPGATVIDPNPAAPKIKFPSPDTGNAYWVRLTGYYPNCTYTAQKSIRIYPYDPNAVVTPADYNRGIKRAELFPNPNNGQFTLDLEFYKLQRATVYITDVTGFVVVPAQVYAPTLRLTKNYLSEMNGKQPGTYFLRIVSDYDSRNILFVKQ